MVAIRKPAGTQGDAWGYSEVVASPSVADEAPPIHGHEDGVSRLLRPLRRDALPEHTRYVDTGCAVHSSCLTCPLVRCRYDEPGGARAVLGQERDRTILSLRAEGRPISLIAQRFAISRRTVFRVLAASRDAKQAGVTVGTRMKERT
jgi:hypothetical protein